MLKNPPRYILLKDKILQKNTSKNLLYTEYLNLI